MRSSSKLGRRTVLFVGGFLSLIGIALIPIYVHPKLYPEIYSKLLLMPESEVI